MTCERPAKEDASKPWHKGEKKKMKEVVGPVFKPNSSNICETANPCENGASCHFSPRRNDYKCRCLKGWTGKNCTQSAEFDPCSSNPCQNGATCQAKKEKGQPTTYECYCARDYGGPSCDQRPCEQNPCQNNGTCRTTRSHQLYFCDCPNGFGGRDCDVAIGQTPPEKFGKNVEQVSSGRAEWVNEMKLRFANKKKSDADDPEGAAAAAKEAAAADEPYKDAKQKKREREEKEEKEKLEAAAIQKAEEGKRKKAQQEEEVG
ncbi:unnamed protein product, partial [Mesorhabditis spiculigera]